MKKSTKFLLFGGMICFGLGLLITVVTTAVAGTGQVAYMFQNGDFSIGSGMHLLGMDIPEYNFWREQENQEWVQSIQKSNEKIGSRDDIQSIDISFGGGSLEIEESDDEYFYLEINHRTPYSYTIKKGVFILQPEYGTHIKGNGKVTLYIPKDKMFETVNVQIGGGKAEIEQLVCDDAQLTIGAGKVTVKNLQADNATIEMGAGEIELEDATVDSLTMPIAMGKMKYKGQIRSNAVLECAMGDIELSIAGKQADFNYDLECGMGRISMNGDRLYKAGIGVVKNIHNNADKDIEISCVMADVNLNFFE